MDSKIPVPSPDVLDAKPSFRKPSNDAANRKYRRHSSADISDSSSTDDSPKHERNHSPVFSKEDRVKMDGGKRKNEDRDSDKWTSASYHDYHRHDDRGRHRRAAEEERNSWRSSGSGRDSRSGNRFEHGRHESYYNRSRENNHTVENYSRDKRDIDRHSKDKSDSRTYRSKEAIDYERHNDRRLSSDRVSSRDRYERSYKDDIKSREQDRYRDRGVRDEKRERQRSPGDYKNDDKTFNEGVKGHAKDSRAGKDRAAIRRKETYLSSIKEVDGATERKREHDDRDNDKHKDKYVRCEKEEIWNEDKGQPSFHDKHERGEGIKDKSYAVEDTSSKKHKSGRSEKPADEHDVKAIASLRQIKEDVANVSSEAVGSSNSQADATQDFDAAKIAAMKAAELVNRNLIGGGSFLSTDQKKKLLWGNKKNTSAEESGNQWDLPLFTDRERQEKFNKLMSLRLPWYLWPTVGCEGRSEGGVQTRRQGWQPSSGEAGAAPDGLGEAIHCWTQETGWQDRRSWSVTSSFPGTPQERSLSSFSVSFCFARCGRGLCWLSASEVTSRRYHFVLKKKILIKGLLGLGTTSHGKCSRASTALSLITFGEIIRSCKLFMQDFWLGIESFELGHPQFGAKRR